MKLAIIAALATIALATPAVAADQARQQTRDPSTHVDGAAPTQDRLRTRDMTHTASQEATRERSRAMTGGGSGKASGGGTGAGGGSGSAYRGGR